MLHDSNGKLADGSRMKGYTSNPFSYLQLLFQVLKFKSPNVIPVKKIQETLSKIYEIE